uniref:Phytosulfokine n=1 Tax=Cucumis melo TaxID=3656 RepID=A0A9I9E8Q0_CUCME
MSKKLAALFTIIAALVTIMSLIVIPSSEAARPIPSLFKPQNPIVSRELVADHNNEGISCEGLGKEDCLIKRTLQAHIDYLQFHN